MPPFYRINGDWFHSRSSSNYGELQSVRALVAASRKAEYCGLKWSSGRGQEPRLYQFGGEVGVQPSTMQTKIRAMIRYGFVQESEHCPLRWTRLGRLWSDLVNVGNEEAAQDIYRFTLVHALAFFAFNERGYAKTLNGVFFPLRELLRKTREGRIAEKDFRRLVDGATQRTGKNESYWRTDLLNSGMFEVTSGFLTVSPRFGELAEAIKSYPFERMSDDEWREFRANQLWEKGPFKETLGELLLSVNRPKTADEVILIPLENAFAETLDISIAEQESDLLKNPQTKTLTVLQRSAAWSRLVKGRYDSKCVLRGCDVHGSPKAAMTPNAFCADVMFTVLRLWKRRISKHMRQRNRKHRITAIYLMGFAFAGIVMVRLMTGCFR